MEQRATVLALRVSAARMLAAYQQARALEKELRVLVKAVAPVLLAQPGGEREIRRCLKRTVARGLFRLLTRTVLPATGPGGSGAWRHSLPR